MLLWVGCSEAPETGPAMAVERPVRGNRVSPHFTDSDALIREKGKAVIEEAFSLLSSNLLAALSEGGVSNAIPFCSQQALPLTASVSSNHQVNVRRVSHRVRNPRNAPSPRESEVLDEFQSQWTAGRAPAPVVMRTDDAAFFFAPIVLNNPLCLTCHGEPGKDIPSETAALLNRLYPGDQATGFRLNDLRGMWVVEIQPDSER
jgi:hypothetical protein